MKDKKEALEDIEYRLKKLKGVNWFFQDGSIGFRPTTGYYNMSLNAYGRACEICYIYTAFDITEDEFAKILKGTTGKFIEEVFKKLLGK